jgi:hypothetical protein
MGAASGDTVSEGFRVFAAITGTIGVAAVQARCPFMGVARQPDNAVGSRPGLGSGDSDRLIPACAELRQGPVGRGVALGKFTAI